MKVKVGIERVGVATNYRNPDGSLHYAVNTSVGLYIIPQTRGTCFKRARSRGVALQQSNSCRRAKSRCPATSPECSYTSYGSRVETISSFI